MRTGAPPWLAIAAAAGIPLRPTFVPFTPWTTLDDLVDLDKECARLSAEERRLAGLIATQEAKLANEQFVSRAPAPVVQKAREKLASWRDQASVLTARRERLGCLS